MDQGGRLESPAGGLVRQPGGGQPAQLVVHQGQEPFGRARLAPQTASSTRVTAVFAASLSGSDGSMEPPGGMTPLAPHKSERVTKYVRRDRLTLGHVGGFVEPEVEAQIDPAHGILARRLFSDRITDYSLL